MHVCILGVWAELGLFFISADWERAESGLLSGPCQASLPSPFLFKYNNNSFKGILRNVLYFYLINCTEIFLKI